MSCAHSAPFGADDWSKIASHFTESHNTFGWTANKFWSITTDRLGGIFQIGSIYLCWEGGGQPVRVYTNDPVTLPSLYAIIDRIDADIIIQRRRFPDIARHMSAIEEARRTKAEDKFQSWSFGLSVAYRADPFFQMLYAQYKRDHDADMLALSEKVLNAVLGLCKIHGIRFVSIAGYDLVCFEDVQIPRYPHSVQMGRYIAELVGEFSPMGTGPHTQLNIYTLLDTAHAGTYDLRNDSPVKIGPHLITHTMNAAEIIKRYDGEVHLGYWLMRCGVEKVDVAPYDAIHS